MAGELGAVIRKYRKKRWPRPWSVQDLANCLVNDTPPFASGNAQAAADFIETLEAGGAWTLPDADLLPFITSCARCLGLGNETEELFVAGCTSLIQKTIGDVEIPGLKQDI